MTRRKDTSGLLPSVLAIGGGMQMPLSSVARPHILWAGYFQTFGPTDCLRGVTQVIIISGKQNHPLLMDLHKYKLVVSLLKLFWKGALSAPFLKKKKKSLTISLEPNMSAEMKPFFTLTIFFLTFIHHASVRNGIFPAYTLRSRRKRLLPLHSKTTLRLHFSTVILLLVYSI